MVQLSLERIVRKTAATSSMLTLVAALALPRIMYAQSPGPEPQPVPIPTPAASGENPEAFSPPPLVPPSATKITNVEAPSTPLETSVCTNVVNCNQLGNEKFGAGDYSDAAGLFKKAFELTSAGTTPVVTRATLLYNIAISYELAGDPQSAIHFYELYSGMKKSDPVKVREFQARRSAMQLYEVGRKSLADGKLDEALNTFQNALLLYPPGKAPSALCMDIGKIYERKTEVTKAVDHYQQCVNMEPSESVKGKILSYINTLTARIEAEQQLQKLAEQPVITSIFTPAPTPGATKTTTTTPQESFFGKYMWGLTLGGVAVGAAATGLIFNAQAAQKFEDLKSGCAPNCNDSDIAGLESKVTLRNIAYGVAGAAAVAAGILFWRAAGREETLNNPSASNSVNTSLDLGLGQVAYRVSF